MSEDQELSEAMSIDSEALFRGHIYRVTGEPVVANPESNIGTARELHLERCRTLRKYRSKGTALPRVPDDEVAEAWIRAIEENTTTETLATEWPFSDETGWCPHCIVKILTVGSDGNYRHPGARSPKWRPGVPLDCRFPTAHGLGHCGCRDG